MTIESEFQDFGAIYNEHMKKSVKIDVFEILSEDLLKENEGANIVDFSIIDVQISNTDSRRFGYTIDMVLMTETQVITYEVSISYKEGAEVNESKLSDRVDVEAKRLNSTVLSQEGKIHCILSE